MRLIRSNSSVVVSLVLATVLLAAFGELQAGELRQIRSIGLSSDDPIYFIRPYDIDWDSEGNAYVLSGADCRVVCFDSDWSYSHSFSRQGSAPGELNMVMQLLVIEGRVWVKVPRGAEEFDLAGEYVGLVRMPLDVSSIVYFEGSMFGVARSTKGIGVELTLGGDVATHFGPPASPVSDLMSIVRSQGWQPVPMGGGQCGLLDRFDGYVWRPKSDGQSLEQIDLGIGRGQNLRGQGFRNAVVDVSRDPVGGYFLLRFDHENRKRYLIHYGQNWQKDGEWVIPKEVVVGTVRVSPRDEVCLLSESESVLYVYERPRAGGSE